MLVCTTWKARPLTSEQAERMMQVWGKIEADLETRTASQRLCWYVAADGSSGVTVSEVIDPDAAAQFQLETSLALGEFLELDAKQVLDMDSAMPAILSALERAKG